jgi:hypothetical protein
VPVEVSKARVETDLRQTVSDCWLFAAGCATTGSTPHAKVVLLRCFLGR